MKTLWSQTSISSLFGRSFLLGLYSFAAFILSPIPSSPPLFTSFCVHLRVKVHHVSYTLVSAHSLKSIFVPETPSSLQGKRNGIRNRTLHSQPQHGLSTASESHHLSLEHFPLLCNDYFQPTHTKSFLMLKIIIVISQRKQETVNDLITHIRTSLPATPDFLFRLPLPQLQYLCISLNPVASPGSVFLSVTTEEVLNTVNNHSGFLTSHSRPVACYLASAADCRWNSTPVMSVIQPSGHFQCSRHRTSQQILPPLWTFSPLCLHYSRIPWCFCPLSWPLRFCFLCCLILLAFALKRGSFTNLWPILPPWLIATDTCTT